MVSLRHLVGRLERSFPGKANGVRTDLVLLLIMSGNDYLPKVRRRDHVYVNVFFIMYRCGMYTFLLSDPSDGASSAAMPDQPLTPTISLL